MAARFRVSPTNPTGGLCSACQPLLFPYHCLECILPLRKIAYRAFTISSFD